MIEPRKPLPAERELIYLAGFDPSESLVVQRLNDIMTICSRADPSERHRIDELRKKEIPQTAC